MGRVELTPLEQAVLALLPEPPQGWKWRDNRCPSIRPEQVPSHYAVVNLTLLGFEEQFNISVMAHDPEQEPAKTKYAEKGMTPEQVFAMSLLMQLQNMAAQRKGLLSVHKSSLYKMAQQWIDANVTVKTANISVGPSSSPVEQPGSNGSGV